MRKLLASNLLAMVGTNQSGEFNIMEGVPKKKEVKYIQIIYDYEEGTTEQIITRGVFGMNYDVTENIPPLPSQYRDSSLEESRVQTIDPTTGAVTLTINYTNYTALYTISFGTNSNSDYGTSYPMVYTSSGYAISSIVVPSEVTMEIGTNYTPNSPAVINFYLGNGLFAQVNATPPTITDDEYVIGFTYASSGDNFIDEGKPISLQGDTSIYGLYYRRKTDITIDCSNGAEFIKTNDDDGCGFYKWTGTSVVEWDTQYNTFRRIYISSYRGSSSTQIETIAAPDGYRVNGIIVTNPSGSSTTVNSQNYYYSIPGDGVGLWTISASLEEYHGYQYYGFAGDSSTANEIWWTGGLYQDTAWMNSVSAAAVASGCPSGTLSGTKGILRVEGLDGSCNTVSPTTKYYLIGEARDGNYNFAYTIFIDMTNGLGTYFTYSNPYSGNDGDCHLEVSTSDMATFVKTCPYVISTGEYTRYVDYGSWYDKCLYRTYTSAYNSALSSYESVKNGCVSGIDLLI